MPRSARELAGQLAAMMRRDGGRRRGHPVAAHRSGGDARADRDAGAARRLRLGWQRRESVFRHAGAGGCDRGDGGQRLDGVRGGGDRRPRCCWRDCPGRSRRNGLFTRALLDEGRVRALRRAAARRGRWRRSTTRRRRRPRCAARLRPSHPGQRPCCKSRPSTTASAATCSTRRWRIRWRPRRSARLYARLAGPVALYDPDGIADALLALYPDAPRLAGAVTCTTWRRWGGARRADRARADRTAGQRCAHRADRGVRCGAHRRAHRASAAAGRRRC